MHKIIKKTVIIAGYNCNNRCRFCINANKKTTLQKSTQLIVEEIKSARHRDRDYLELIGGELTIRPDFFYLIRTAKKLGFKEIAVATNGRMLSYKDFAKKTIESGITEIIFSIHGHTSQLHDSLTQAKGSFKQLLKGLKNIKSFNFKKIGSNTTIVKQNYKLLPKIGKLIYNLGIRNAEFIFVDPTRGGAYENFNDLVPEIFDSAPFIRKCLRIGKIKKDIKHWHIRYVPLCYFKNYENQISELYEAKHFQTEHLAPDFENFNVEKSRKTIGRIKPQKCEFCAKFSICEGLWLEYFRHFGDKEIVPLE